MAARRGAQCAGVSDETDLGICVVRVEMTSYTYPSPLTAAELVSVVMIHTELCCILFSPDLYFIILFNLYCIFFLLPFSPLTLPTLLHCILALAGG